MRNKTQAINIVSYVKSRVMFCVTHAVALVSTVIHKLYRSSGPKQATDAAANIRDIRSHIVILFAHSVVWLFLIHLIHYVFERVNLHATPNCKYIFVTQSVTKK